MALTFATFSTGEINTSTSLPFTAIGIVAPYSTVNPLLNKKILVNDLRLNGKATPSVTPTPVRALWYKVPNNPTNLAYFTANAAISGSIYNETNPNVPVATTAYPQPSQEPSGKVYYGLPWMFQPLTVIDDQKSNQDAPIVYPGEILGLEVESEGTSIPFEVDVMTQE
jgi:hypothetical protein